MQEIVIKIPEEIYKNKNYIDYFGCSSLTLADAIENGTVLPKGHGALKDFDKIEWYGCDFEGRGCIEAKGDCSVCSHANCDANQVRGLPTIIEADKAERR
jgi:hypothetical protein